MRIFKNVLFATRKPQAEINYEVVQQAEIIPKQVPTVPHSPAPHRPQADFHCCGARASVKPPSKQVPSKHTHSALKNSFLHIF
jgi:hypothetical protein